MFQSQIIHYRHCGIKITHIIISGVTVNLTDLCERGSGFEPPLNNLTLCSSNVYFHFKIMKVAHFENEMKMENLSHYSSLNRVGLTQPPDLPYASTTHYILSLFDKF